LNRPEVLNSFNAKMAEDVQRALREAADDPAVRAVLLTGCGRAFSSGQDLSEVLPRDGRPGPDLGDIVGVAAGAGANLAFACDIVVASEEAVFIQSFGKIGLIPDSGGTFILPRIVGLQRAAALTMLGEKLPASRAKEWGLVYDVVPSTVLASTTFEIAKRLACLPTRGFGLTKRGFNSAFANDLDTQLGLEEELQAEAGRTADYAEGVQAFIEKRPPRFKGC
jgi:2-(1,2-epoxy-1,2-dihydrophenyl)acetyl-CoA isomerase